MRGLVLITRPKEDAAAVAEMVIERGYQAFCEPFLEVVFHQGEIPVLENYHGLVFTSANGVRAFCRNSPVRNLAVYTVGDQTLAEARKAGFKIIKSAGGKVDDLIRLLEQEQGQKPCLYIRGDHISKDLKKRLGEEKIVEIILYHTEKKDKMSDLVRELLLSGAFSHILFFSRRTAESFVALIGEDAALKNALKGSKALCLGDSMVQYLSVLSWKDIQVASHPDRDGIMALLK